MRAPVTGLVEALVDLVLPRACVGCGTAGTLLCPACLPAGGCRAASGLPVPVVAAAEYDAAVRRAVIAYKERGRRDLARPLGALLAGAVEAVARSPGSEPRSELRSELRSEPPAGLLLVPVPSSAAAARARGGDHVRRLARAAAADLRRGGLATGVARPLRLVRAVEDSTGLGAGARAANLAGALAAGPAPARGPHPAPAVVLVDDVATTGATLREAVRALRAAGWPVWGAAVVAATPAPAGDRGPDRRPDRGPDRCPDRGGDRGGYPLGAGSTHTGTNPADARR